MVATVKHERNSKSFEVEKKRALWATLGVHRKPCANPCLAGLSADLSIKPQFGEKIAPKYVSPEHIEHHFDAIFWCMMDLVKA
jgi:hypothetical protein